jgi:hypothetical protein
MTPALAGCYSQFKTITPAIDSTVTPLAIDQQALEEDSASITGATSWHR